MGESRVIPFESHFTEVDGARVHYIDEGQGPVFLGLHGNPTWSFLYRHIVNGLKDRFRCIALDYPGFGLSTAPSGYSYTVAEHSRVVEGFVTRLGLADVTLMVQDWGGPIGLSVAVRHPERFRAFVVGNTFGWPVRGGEDLRTVLQADGQCLPGRPPGEASRPVHQRVRPGGIKRRKLSKAERDMYKRPHPTAQSRIPVHVMPREILAAHELLSEVEQGLPRLADRPALIVWGDRGSGVQGIATGPLGANLPQPQDGDPDRGVALHPGRRSRGHRRRDPRVVARGVAAAPYREGPRPWTMHRAGLEAVDLALRHLAGQPMSREEAQAMRGARAIGELPADDAPRGVA